MPHSQEDETTEQEVEKQSDDRKEIADKVWDTFDQLRNVRDRSFAYFRERTLMDYMNDNNMLFNNYRIKPDFKDEWQGNISDVTTHSKLMAVTAQTNANRLKSEFTPRHDISPLAAYKASLIQSVDNYINTTERNGEIDSLAVTIKALREGTVIGYLDYKNTELKSKVDFQIVPLDDFYPGNILEFDMGEQIKCVWRTVMPKETFDEFYTAEAGWEDVDLVRSAGNVAQENKGFFAVSLDVREDQVEIIREFDLVKDSFRVTANRVLITPNESKMTGRFSSGNERLPFLKSVYEMYDDRFFYGRSFADILKDNQDAIDYMFNNIFDRATISLLKPIFVGAVNNEIDEDFWYPGKQIAVRDATQVNEMKIDPPDMTAFKILQELQNRQNLGGGDPTNQGVAPGRRTKFEVEAAGESAQKITSLFSTMMKDWEIQRGRLMKNIIFKHYIKQDKLKPLIIENSRLLKGKTGTKIIRFTESPAPADVFGFSPKLLLESKIASINGNETVIAEAKPSSFKNFEVDVKISANARPELSQSLKRAVVEKLTTKFYMLPKLFNPNVVAKMDVENNRDIIGEFADDILIGEEKEKAPLLPGQEEEVPDLKAVANQQSL